MDGGGGVGRYGRGLVKVAGLRLGDKGGNMCLL